MREFFATAPKKSRDNKIIDGVCAGFAKQFGIDPFWTRLLFALLVPITAGFVIFMYMVLVVIMPSDSLNSSKSLNSD